VDDPHSPLKIVNHSIIPDENTFNQLTHKSRAKSAAKINGRNSNL